MKRVFSSDGGVSKKAAQGTFWLFCFRITDQVLRLARTVVLARLLAPNDFGLFGITVLAVSLLETFSQNGFAQALIQKKGDIKPYLDSAFIVQVARSLLLALILFFTAPFIALFFNAPPAEQILKVVALAVALQGFYNIAAIYFQKELEFHKYFFYQIIGTLADVLVSVVLAIMFRNVWALVFGLLAGTVARLVTSYLVHSFYPRFTFDLSKVKELFSFGKWIFVSNIVVFFILQADSFFVAKMLGVSALGFYQIAYKIPSILAIEIIAGAIFPAYAKIQDDIVKIRGAYLKILKLFAFILMPMAGGIFVLTREFIILFLGEKWLPAFAPMQVLILSTLIWTIAFLSNYVFLALGKPEVDTKGIAIRFALLVVLLYPFIVWWGVLGASVAVLLSVVASASWFIVMALKTLNCRLEDFLKSIAIPFVNTLGMMVAIFIFKNILTVAMGNFLLLVVIGVLVYLALAYIADKFFKNGMMPLVKESINLFIR